MLKPLFNARVDLWETILKCIWQLQGSRRFLTSCKNPETPFVLIVSWEAGKVCIVCPKFFLIGTQIISLLMEVDSVSVLCVWFCVFFLISKNFVFSIGKTQIVRGHLDSISVLGKFQYLGCSPVLVTLHCILPLESYNAAELSHFSF